MIDLTTIPSRLTPLRTEQGPITVERINSQHQQAFLDASIAAKDAVHPWMGTSLCPTTPLAAKQSIEKLEQARQAGFGVAYLMMFEGKCLGFGAINYIHPTHLTANLGYWIHPNMQGQGLAMALCKVLCKLAQSQLNLIRLELYIEPANVASIKVASKLGAVKEGLCRKRVFGRDAYLYGLLLAQ